MPGNATGPPTIAKATLATRCASCANTIRRGDAYRIVPWDGGFDYHHVNCRVANRQPPA